MEKILLSKVNIYEFALYEEKSGEWKLYVPTAFAAPGFDIEYTLNEEERKAFLVKGDESLRPIAEKMRENPRSYKLNSWK
ncbi:MAG: hypothetical protein ACK4TA_02400 [Saprospiraceae bacterium]